MEKPCFCLVSVWIVSALVLVTMRSSVESAGDVWDEVSSLKFLDGEEFKRVVNPFVQITANSYRYPGVQAIPGWTLVDAVAPDHGGMHAVVYQDDSNTARMVLAFRGTDLSGSESSRADYCADYILWGTAPTATGNCSEFSSDTLDYYKQAVDYTREMLAAHPQASFLLSGHSLGAGLAILVSTTLSSTQLLPVVAFSSPGTEAVLERMSLKLTSDHEEKFYIVADKWDAVVRFGWKDQIGTLCLYETNITKNCVECFKENTVSSACSSNDDSSSCTDIGPDTASTIQNPIHQGKEVTDTYPDTEVNQNGPASVPSELSRTLLSDSAECVTCFFQTNYLNHVIELVELGNKPVCEVRWISNPQALSSIRRGTQL